MTLEQVWGMSDTRRVQFSLRTLLIALAIGAVGVMALAIYFRPRTPPVQWNTLVNDTEEQIRSRFGNPVKDSGYELLGLEHRPKAVPGPVRTLIFDLEGGWLWVWLTPEVDSWVCFESCWFADGVAF